MNINKVYSIRDNRNEKDFSDKTFCGYKKKDVLAIFDKSLLEGKTENACNWSTEIIISGYLDNLWERIIVFVSKYININIPNIAFHIFNRFSKYNKIKNQEYYKTNFLELRNNQIIRNHICEVICILSHAQKQKYSNLKKIQNSEFQFDNIKLKILSENDKLINRIFDNNDPKEIRIILNEFYNSLDTNNLINTLYWLSWLIEWEKLNIKKYGNYKCGFRKITGVDTKYHTDLIWIIWEIILKISLHKDVDFINKQIQSLYQLYKYNFASSKKTKKLPIIIHSIRLLIERYSVSQPIINKNCILIQACGKINYIYYSKKKYEIGNESHIKLSDINDIQATLRVDKKERDAFEKQKNKKNSKEKKKTKPNEESEKKLKLMCKIDNIVLEKSIVNRPPSKPKNQPKNEINQYIENISGNSDENMIKELESIFGM